jgi:homoserine kinase
MVPVRRRSRGPAGIFKISLPATSANLGPAFDAAALAFRLYLRVRAEPSPELRVSARGRDADVCARVEKHLILETYSEVLSAERKTRVPLALQIDNEMPIGKGCGSSAAARLAGIALAVHYGGLDWDDARIIGEASRREHHPDNAAACWMGGLAVARMSGECEAQVVKFAPKGKWPLLFVVPEKPLSTEAARRILPAQYSRQDTVSNIQNSMLLLAAFVQGRRDILSSALDDHIHQPYRAALCPLLPAIREMAGTSGVLGAALSGAGPSVLVFLDPKMAADRVSAQVHNHLRSHHLDAELITTSIAGRGARDEVHVGR